jgi:hypothetical protein
MPGAHPQVSTISPLALDLTEDLEELSLLMPGDTLDVASAM